MRVFLCGKSGCCPAVDIQDEKVTIGETGNQVTLNKDEWNALVTKIRSEELKTL